MEHSARSSSHCAAATGDGRAWQNAELFEQTRSCDSPVSQLGARRGAFADPVRHSVKRHRPHEHASHAAPGQRPSPGHVGVPLGRVRCCPHIVLPGHTPVCGGMSHERHERLFRSRVSK